MIYGSIWFLCHGPCFRVRSPPACRMSAKRSASSPGFWRRALAPASKARFWFPRPWRAEATLMEIIRGMRPRQNHCNSSLERCSSPAVFTRFLAQSPLWIWSVLVLIPLCIQVWLSRALSPKLYRSLNTACGLDNSLGYVQSIAETMRLGGRQCRR